MNFNSLEDDELDELEERGLAPRLVEARMGEARETHICLYLSVNAIEDIPSIDGGVVIDPTMDQFCTENARAGKTDVDFGPEDVLPEVAIHEPGAEERIVSYFCPKTPAGIYDSFPHDEAIR